MICNLFHLISAAFAIAAFVALPGCGSSTPSTDDKPAIESGHYEGDGHDHSGEEAGHFEGDGHDHGSEVSDSHPMEGPHGGHLIELGNEEYHAELLHDENTYTVTVYLLDGPAKQTVAVPLDEITVQLFQDGQFVKYALKAVRGPEAPSSAASQFEIVDKALCIALSHEDGLRGRLQVTIDGKAYTGTIEHSNHESGGDDGHNHS